MRLISRAFAEGGLIPRRFTRDGDNLSPPLHWRAAPAATRSFVLAFSALGAAPACHWTVYDLPGNQSVLGEGVPPRGARVRQALNDFAHAGYAGPRLSHAMAKQPYRFRLLALRTGRLAVPEHPTASEVLRAAGPFILAEAVLNACWVRAPFGYSSPARETDRPPVYASA